MYVCMHACMHECMHVCIHVHRTARRALGHIIYFDECLQSMREAFGNHQGGEDAERQEILNQACVEFTEMSVRLKETIEPGMLQLLATLPLKPGA